MKDVDHTDPHTDESFGGAFRRGPDVAADGGARGAANGRATGGSETDERTTDGSGADGRTTDERTSDDHGTEEIDDELIGQNAAMSDVDHESPTDSTSRLFDRGIEKRDESA